MGGYQAAEFSLWLTCARKKTGDVFASRRSRLNGRQSARGAATALIAL